MVTYSPIFTTPNKGSPKGCKDLKKIVQSINIPVIALGGINESNYKMLWLTKVKGFAGISWIKKNGLNKFRPFYKL